jgi:hypothetical protein
MGCPEGENNCCADTADESASDATSAAVATRISEQGIGMVSPVSAQGSRFSE